MKKSEIQVGRFYSAKVSDNLVTVRVKSIEKRPGSTYRTAGTVYVCENLKTGREVTFKSAQRFRSEVEAQRPHADKIDKPSKPSLKEKLNESKRDKVRHIVVEALAGTGKTFTMIVGVLHALAPKLWGDFTEVMRQRAKDPELEIVPSDEQRAIWDYLRGFEGQVTSVVYCAFNKSIVSEFAEQWGFMQELLQTVGINLRFSTVNSLGNQACARSFGRLKVNSYRTDNLVEKITGIDGYELKRDYPVLLSATVKLVDLCKLNLTGWTEGEKFDPSTITDEDLDQLSAHYDIDLNGDRRRVYQLVPQVLQESLNVTTEIDFNDQNWLPVVLNLPIPKADLLTVDEGQDLPRCKQEFCRRAARNLVVVGDANQAIYGFAGADVDSIPRMKQLLGVTDPFRLTATRRCGKAIVAEANVALQQVYGYRNETPVEFLAHETNPAGIVSQLSKAKYMDAMDDGDMVLSRVNAPLVSHALQLIKQGRKANIRGREFGTEMINFIKRLKASDVSDLIEKTERWYDKEAQNEAAKKNPSEAKLISLEDRRDCIMALAEGATDLNDVTKKVETIFSGKVCPRCGRQYSETVDCCYNSSCKTEIDPLSGYPCGPKLVTPKGVLFSSVHRAKGLEARRVFVLTCDGSAFPHPMAKTRWQVGQEYNLKYVAVTRAIEELVYVS